MSGNNPIPALLGTFLVIGAVYQLFFRYEHWQGGPSNTITFERDGLTGVVRQMEPGKSVNWLDRLLGKGGQPGGGNLPFMGDAPPSSPGSAPSTARTGGAPAPASLPPVPDADKTEPTTRQIAGSTVQSGFDLNQDGHGEQLIQTPVAGQTDDKDISIVTQDGKELLYTRGKSAAALPSKTAGWQDVALQTVQGQQVIYRFNATLGSYEPAGAPGIKAAAPPTR